MTECTSSSIPPAEIKITIKNGLIIPSTATPLEQDAEDPIFSIFCYTSSKDIKISLRINKSTIQNAFQDRDFFKCTQEGYLVAVHGKVLEKTDGYFSVFVSDITVASSPVLISDELKYGLGIIVQGLTPSQHSTQQATEMNVVKVQNEQYKSLHKNSADHKMEISSILLDTSVDLNVDFEDFSDIQCDVSGDTETNTWTQKTNETFQESIIDMNVIEAANDTIFNDLAEGSEVVESTADITATIETEITGILPVDSKVQSDQLSSALEPIIVTDKYPPSPPNQYFSSIQTILNQPQLVDPIQENYLTKEIDQDTVNSVAQEVLRKDIGHQINTLPEENALIHSTERKEVQHSSMQKESLTNNYVQGNSTRNDVAKENLQVNSTSKEDFNNIPYQHVQFQELPKVHEIPPSPKKLISSKIQVQKRKKMRTILDPKELRRSPRLALKQRVQYFPLKGSRIHKNITLS